ncbi:helix-turn-helix transcriptional regulator [Roseovarius phycicola]|uniref:Helix-turn-helix transcriptional regulator n=1 Tax=Roseovarius phycicola TaxID=3080976 RepID=A0ABZ2HN76_9RHOB
MSEAPSVTDPDYLTVKELADLLRLKERKVYDLAASGDVPCSRVTGKLLFPRQDILAWINQGQSGGMVANASRPAVFLGSHDPVLEWALRHSRCELATFFDGSLDGLARVRAGEGVAAGLHVYDGVSGTWNVPVVEAGFAGQNMVLVGFATRRRGLVMEHDLMRRIHGVADLGGRRVVERQPESGTAKLFQDLLDQAGLRSSEVQTVEVARSEMEAVLTVSQSGADVAFGLEPLARQFGLGFVPVIEEQFDLLVDRKAWFDEGFQRFVAFCNSKVFHAQIKTQAGYDVSDFGKVRWNG